MEELGPMDFFTETDRVAIIQQLRARQAASRNIVEYYQAMREMLDAQDSDPETSRRIEELDKGITAAEAKVRETEAEISRWEH